MFEYGQEVVCTHSTSPGYREGRVYKVVCLDGKKGLMADDGFFDPLNMLQSKFELATQKQISVAKG